MTDYDSFYAEIRQEMMNKEGRMPEALINSCRILANEYTEKTHFIYELLQNTEDACARAKAQEPERRCYIRLQLNRDELSIRHNGILFDEKDIKSICSVGKSTKEGDPTQAGRWGAGFKSVFYYTKSPEIHSGDASFVITDYLLPYAIRQKEIEKDETLIVIPFNQDLSEVSESGSPFESVGKELKEIPLRSLLFIQNLDEIRTPVAEYTKNIIRIDQEIDEISITRRSFEQGDKDSDKEEKWIVFNTFLDDDKQTRDNLIQIAYKLAASKDGKKQIVQVGNSVVYSLFPTKCETHLKFLINARYLTTPSREGITDEPRNKLIIEKTAELVATSISEIRKMELLDVGYLNVLPIESESFIMSDLNQDPPAERFSPIFNKVKEVLGNEDVLPTNDGSYSNASNSVIGTGALRDLLNPVHLKLLTKKQNPVWLDERITKDRQPALFAYLKNELGINEFDVSEFARKINKEFLEKQPEEWFSRFYSLLLDNRSLWKKSAFQPYTSEQIHFLNNPIIKLCDGRTVPPFVGNYFWDIQVFLPRPDKKFRELPTVSDVATSNHRALEFLTELGVKLPNPKDYILNKILPKYKDPKGITSEENIADVEKIIIALRESVGDDRKVLADELKHGSFLLGIPASSAEKKWVAPEKVYLLEPYTEKDTYFMDYYQGCDAYYLDPGYSKFAGKDDLVMLGCLTEIKIRYTPNRALDGKGSHSIGVDGFDVLFDIDNLSSALSNITIKRAKIIWDLALKYSPTIRGKYGTKQYVHASYTFRDTFSGPGRALSEKKWIPDKNGEFHTPSEICLSDVNDDLDTDNSGSKILAEKLGMRKPESEEKQVEKAKQIEKAKEFGLTGNEDELWLLEMMKKDPDCAKKLRAKVDNDEEISQGLPPEKNPAGQFEKSLGRKGAKLTTGLGRESPTRPISPEDEQELRKNYGGSYDPNNYGRERGPKTAGKLRGHGPLDGREFLRSEYRGYCQICKQRIITENGEGFEVHRLMKTKDTKFSEMEGNLVCACPNCNALLENNEDYKDLTNIREFAEKHCDHTPQEVEGEMRYVIPIELGYVQKGRDEKPAKFTEIVYSQNHFNKLIEFIRIIYTSSAD